MPSPAFIRLSPTDKLDVLRALDRFRRWDSLDDERLCLVCGKSITGRQIEVSGGDRDSGALELHCPTENCSSIPMDWALPNGRPVKRQPPVADGPTEMDGKAAKESPRSENARITKEADKIAHAVVKKAWRAFRAATAASRFPRASVGRALSHADHGAS